MKKNYKICLNFTEAEYKQLQRLAEKDRRKLAEFVALVVLDATEQQRAECLRIGQPTFKKAEFPSGIYKNKN